MQIQKFQLPDRQGEYKIQMGLGSRPMKVGDQHGVLTLWCRVPIRRTQKEYTFAVVYTGDPEPWDGSPRSDAWLYLDTVIMRGGDHVVHVYWKQEL